VSAIRIGKQGNWLDGKGVITVKVSSELRTIEREVEKQSRLETDLTPPPLFDTPNRYSGKKKWVHPEHAGERWTSRSQFTHDGRMSDGLHSYCNACRARDRKNSYVAKWKRGTLTIPAKRKRKV